VFADIYRSWDYRSGLGFSTITSLCLGWIGVFIVMLFWLSTFSGLLPARIEITILKIVNLCAGIYERKGNVGRDRAAASFFAALYITLLFLNLRAHLPGFYRIPCDLFIVLSISSAIVIIGNLIYCCAYWFNYFPVFIKEVIEKRSIAVVVAIAECLRRLIRPIILAVRLFINIIVGQFAVRLLYAILQPVILKLRVVRSTLKTLLCTVLTVWELGVGIFQATLFVYLCLVYRGDGSYSR